MGNILKGISAKGIKLYKTVSRLTLILAILTFGIFIDTQSRATPALADDGYCPSGMTPEACLEYLQEQAEQIGNDLSNLENALSDEEYQQLSLYEQINYYRGVIDSTQSKIDLLEVEIEKNNVEITILTEEIEILESNIQTASQEITKLENAIQKRVGISYKYSAFSPMELLFNTSELDSLTRKIQYLKQTREYDQGLLNSMSEVVAELKVEKKILADKKLEVQNKQAENESKKTELFDERVALDQQKAVQQNLLAQSQQREQEYLASISQLESVQNGVTAQITQLIFELYQSGNIPVNTPVSAGDIIGLQGSTGLITGSHLHFEYRINGVITNPNGGCLSIGGYGSAIGSAGCTVPLDGGHVTQFPHSNSYAVDAVSYTGGDQPGSYYWGEAISCLGYYIPAGWRSTRGEGAFVRAIKDGMVSAVQTDVCGGKYVIIDHGDGEASLYLHLK